MDLSQRILSYKKRLHDDSLENKELRHVLKRLESIPITVDLLTETGIGKSVNERLRHHPELGSRAKQLVRRWKDLVEKEEARRQRKNGEAKTEAAKKAEKPKEKHKRRTEEGFTANSGFSFDAILTMNDGQRAKASPKKRKTPVQEPDTAGPSRLKPELDWSRVLPKLDPNYQPPYRRNLIEPDDTAAKEKKSKGESGAIDPDLFKAKKSRTQVFAGRRNVHYTSVPTLFDLCMAVICDNVDAIEDTGDIPFEILRPALERATPAQLFYIEENNSYLVEDTDILWEKHCQKDFRGAELEDDESCRELYKRKLHEREEKLKQLTAKVSANSRAAQAPKRLAKTLSEAKAPRDVRRRQIKFGTSGAVAGRQLPSAQSIADVRRKLDEAPDSVHVKQTALYRPAGDLSVSAGAPFKKKPSVPPMMAKTLKLLAKTRQRK